MKLIGSMRNGVKPPSIDTWLTICLVNGNSNVGQSTLRTISKCSSGIF